MARKKAISKGAGRKAAKAAASDKPPARKKATAAAGRKVAKKKAVSKTAAMKKAATNDIVLTTDLVSATGSELEAAFLCKTKSMEQFRSELGWGK